MRIRGLWRYSRFLLLAALVAAGYAPVVFATTSSSSHYQITESEFGAGSSQQTCSAQYCSRTSIGSMAAGESKTTGGSATFGPITPDEPQLEVIIEPGTSNLGDLTTERTATKTSVIKVLSYLSNGYVLQITGSPPKYGNHTLTAPSTPTTSAQGTEQFGINLALNTSPSVGAAPVQVPSGQTSFGYVENDYDNPNQFMYVSGDTVARSLRSSGRTDYTISTIINISNLTPAGHYSGDFSAVVIPVY